MGILAMEGITFAGDCEPLRVDQTAEQLREKYGSYDKAALKTLSPISAYVAYYKKFGQSYHLLPQLESVLTGKKELSGPSPLLLAMFLSELSGMLLTAGHDLDALRQPLKLTVANGGEPYTGISGREITAVAGDLMLCDGEGPVSSILRGPDARTSITSQTKNVLFSIYTPPGVDFLLVEKNLKELEMRVRSVAPAPKTTLLKVY
jgi:DNA/RNA-binding domain of Phe-tRNA-synthetase-like protein